MAKKRANGEGNIRKRKDGRWEGRYTAGYDAKTGKRIIKNVLGKTQGEVKEKLKKALEETNGLDVSRAADEYTVASWLRTWYELYAKPNVRNPDGSLELTRPKTENSVRLVSIPQTAVDLLVQEHARHPDNPYMFPSPLTGELYHPDSVVNLHKKILKDAGLPHIRFHDLRHPYVKHTTKIFSLRLMDFQAQAYPDARRKTRGACQLHRGGQSQSPVRPLCNRKRFS